jgi:hypothetical protein
MFTDLERPWHTLTRSQRRAKFVKTLRKLELRKRREPVAQTCGEYWQSSSYLQAASILAFSVLETDGKVRPAPGSQF